MTKLLWIGTVCALCGCSADAPVDVAVNVPIVGTYVGISGDGMSVPYSTMIPFSDIGLTPVTMLADTIFVSPDGSWTEHGAFRLTTTRGPTVENFSSGPGAWTLSGTSVKLAEDGHILFNGTVAGSQLSLRSDGHSLLFSR